MPAKKVKKTTTPKRKIIRKTPNINLLKHLNAILVIAGFLFSLLTIGLLSSRSDNYDVRSRGQEYPTITLTITPTAGPVTPTIYEVGNN